MTRRPELWAEFRLLSEINAFSPEEQALLKRFLDEKSRLRHAKKIGYFLARSGIKRVKTLGDFDWRFNPKIPRGKLLEFMAHPWLKGPCNLVLIGPAGVGKTHLAQALCHDAVMKGHQALFISLFDLMAKYSRRTTSIMPSTSTPRSRCFAWTRSATPSPQRIRPMPSFR